MKFIKNLFAKLVGISSAVADFIFPIFSKQFNESLTRLLPEALIIVQELSKNKRFADAKKRDAAFAKLAEVARNEGIAVTSNVLNIAIERAVARLKIESD